MSHRNDEDRINNHIDNYQEGKSVKVFDWIKAAKLIKEYHIRNASLGFDLPVEKAFTILKNGEPVKSNGEDMIQWFDGPNPVLIDDDRREIMDCFFVIHDDDDIYLSKSGKKNIPLSWPEEALDIIDKPFYRKDTQKSKYFQLLMVNPLIFWPLSG